MQVVFSLLRLFCFWLVKWDTLEIVYIFGSSLFRERTVARVKVSVSLLAAVFPGRLHCKVSPNAFVGPSSSFRSGPGSSVSPPYTPLFCPCLFRGAPPFPVFVGSVPRTRLRATAVEVRPLPLHPVVEGQLRARFSFPVDSVPIATSRVALVLYLFFVTVRRA